MRTPFALFICLFLAFEGTAEDAVSILREEIARTAQQRDEARKRFLEIQNEAESQIRTLSGAQLELGERLEAADKSLLELEAEASRSAAAVRRAEAEIAARDRELQEVQQELARRQAELDTLLALPEDQRSSRMQRDLEQQLQAQQVELQEAIQAQELARADREALQELNAELRTSLAETQRSESLSNAKLAALESRLGNLNQELGRLYEERSDLEQEQERLKGVIDDLQTRLTDAEQNRVPRSELEALQETLAAAQQENRNLRQELEERNAIPDLRVAFAEAQRERDLLQAKQKTLATKVDSLQESLAEERRTSSDERERRRGAEVLLGREKRRSSELEKEIRRLKAGLKAATSAGVEQEELAEVAILVADLQEENQLLKQQSDTYRGEANTLMEELTNRDSKNEFQIRELQSMLGEQMIQLTDAQRKIDSLEAKTVTLSAVRRERDSLIQVRDKSRKDMKTLARHIYELRDQLVKSRKMEQQLRASAMEQQRLSREIEKQNRLTQALQKEQALKNRQILELRKRLAAEPRQPQPRPTAP